MCTIAFPLGFTSPKDAQEKCSSSPSAEGFSLGGQLTLVATAHFEEKQITAVTHSKIHPESEERKSALSCNGTKGTVSCPGHGAQQQHPYPAPDTYCSPPPDWGCASLGSPVPFPLFWLLEVRIHLLPSPCPSVETVNNCLRSYSFSAGVYRHQLSPLALGPDSMPVQP